MSVPVETASVWRSSQMKTIKSCLRNRLEGGEGLSYLRKIAIESSKDLSEDDSAREQSWLTDESGNGKHRNGKVDSQMSLGMGSIGMSQTHTQLWCNDAITRAQVNLIATLFFFWLANGELMKPLPSFPQS